MLLLLEHQCKMNISDYSLAVLDFALKISSIRYWWFVCQSRVSCTSLHNAGVRCSSVVRAFAHGAMGRRIDPLDPLSYFSFQPVHTTTGVTKAVVCAILSVGWCI